MLFGFFYGDWTLILLIAAMIFAFVAQYKVKSTFDKYNRINNQSGLSGAEAARKILDSNGLYHVRVEFVRGKLTDHFDPRQYLGDARTSVQQIVEHKLVNVLGCAGKADECR